MGEIGAGRQPVAALDERLLERGAAQRDREEIVGRAEIGHILDAAAGAERVQDRFAARAERDLVVRGAAQVEGRGRSDAGSGRFEAGETND